MTFLTRFERWDPFEELNTLRNRMERLSTRFNFPGTDEEMFQAKWAPTADVVETKDALLIKAELPGMTEQDITVQVENGVLTIEGERKLEKDTEEKGYRRIERSYGSFFRTFMLPPNVQSEKIAANYVNGVLELTIPKKEEAKPRTIAVDVKKKLTAAA